MTLIEWAGTNISGIFFTIIFIFCVVSIVKSYKESERKCLKCGEKGNKMKGGWCEYCYNIERGLD